MLIRKINNINIVCCRISVNILQIGQPKRICLLILLNCDNNFLAIVQKIGPSTYLKTRKSLWQEDTAVATVSSALLCVESMMPYSKASRADNLISVSFLNFSKYKMPITFGRLWTGRSFRNSQKKTTEICETTRQRVGFGVQDFSLKI